MERWKKKENARLKQGKKEEKKSKRVEIKKEQKQK